MRAAEQSFVPGSFGDWWRLCKPAVGGREGRAGAGTDGDISLVKHSGWL